MPDTATAVPSAPNEIADAASRPIDERTSTAATERKDIDLQDYERPDLEPKTEEERLRRKNPLGYSITEPTEEEIEAGEKPV